ncbi:unnamed protein product [Tuber aestivum]|uniref:Uncharacterized protein n=1 Tax=Tuber aestivum TaxID=59557 RepID=A0A292Q193_9PEZI|nr:unnamed protein product [Tuber aestivum]
MAQDILFTLAIVTTIIFMLICIRSVLLRRAKIAQQQQVAEILGQAERGIPAGQLAGAARVDSMLRPAPVYFFDTRPPPVRVRPNANEEVAIEPLPVYEAPPPKYDNVVKGTQPPVEMGNIERGEPSGAAGAGNNPPEYSQEREGDEGVVVVSVATDGSHATVQEGEPRRGIFSTARPFCWFGLLGGSRG